jgi:hypothetical protein
MAARALYAHDELHGRSAAELHDLLFARGVNWNDYPAFFKRGAYVCRTALRTRFTAAEIDALPPLHEARRNPDLLVELAGIAAVEMPPLARVINREAVVFDGAHPVTDPAPIPAPAPTGRAR